MNTRLRAMFCDHLSILRGKYLPNSKIGTDSSRFCRSTFGVHYDKDLLDAPGAMMMQGLPDMELRWEEADIREGWERSTQVVLGDLYDDAAHPWACAQGGVETCNHRLGRTWITPKVGIELEAFALQADDTGRLRPYDTPGAVVYGTGMMSDPLRFNDRFGNARNSWDFRWI